MGLFKTISNFFRKRKQEKLDAAMQTFNQLMCPVQIYYDLKKPAFDEFFASSDEITEQYYSDINYFTKQKISASIKEEQKRIYGKLTDYDLRAIEYRKRTGKMSDLEKRKYRSDLLRKSNHLKAA